MKHISQYQDPNSIVSQINQSLAITAPLLESTLSYESIVEDAHRLNEIESRIPDSLRFELELRMILEGGMSAVSDYYRDLVKGKNRLVEQAAEFLSQSQAKSLIESCKSIADDFKSLRLNESESLIEQVTANLPIDKSSIAAEYGAADVEDVMKNIESPDDLSAIDGSGEGGLLGMAKSLWNALTEGGSPIGILHLVLDVVGLVGDAFGPVGLIADVLNGVIYLIRGKWVLALISFIAAMIPFAGNIMKGMLVGTKGGSKALKIATEYAEVGGKEVIKGEAKVSKGAIDLAAKSTPKELKQLQYLGKTTKEALPKVSRLMDGFFRDFLGKLTGWIPFIGKPLRKFFSGIADTFSGFAGKMGKFADDVPEIVTKAEAQMMDDFFKATTSPGAKIVSKGDNLIVKVPGEASKILPASALKSGGDSLFAKRYGKELGEEMAGTTAKNATSFFKSMDDLVESSARFYDKPMKFIGKSLVITRKLTLFMGKQIWKLINSFGDIQPWTDDEYEAWGSASVQQAMRDKMKEEMDENPGQVYSVPYVDRLSDEPIIQTMHGSINDYAEKFGLPKVIDVPFYTQGKKDKLPEDYKEFVTTVYGPDELDNMSAKVEGMGFDDINESTSFKHIIRFENFK